MTDNQKIVLGLAQIVDNSEAFKYSALGRLNLPKNQKEAVVFCENPLRLMRASDALRSTFSRPWFTADLFDMPEKYRDRDPISVAHAQLEITKNNLRDLLVTIAIYSRGDYRELGQYEEILENIFFSLRSVDIPDPNKIHPNCMKAPFL